jgi:hypothetical protein
MVLSARLHASERSHFGTAIGSLLFGLFTLPFCAMLTPFTELPDDARLWIFAADRELTDTEMGTVRHSMSEFLAAWRAHGSDVEAGFDLQHRQFLLIGSTNALADPSGCSIDAMTRAIRELGQSLGVNFMPSGNIFFRENGHIAVVDRLTFKSLARNGKVDQNTKVYNTMITSVQDLKSGKWEVRAADSWHASLLR